MQAGAKLLQRFRAIDGDIDQPSAAAEAGFEGGAHAGIVVGDEQALHSPTPDAAAEECWEEFPGECWVGSSDRRSSRVGSSGLESLGQCPALVSSAVPSARWRGRRRRNVAP